MMVVTGRPQLAELGRWDEHSMLLSRKNHGVSRQAGFDPLRTFPMLFGARAIAHVFSSAKPSARECPPDLRTSRKNSIAPIKLMTIAINAS